MLSVNSEYIQEESVEDFSRVHVEKLATVWLK